MLFDFNYFMMLKLFLLSITILWVWIVIEKYFLNLGLE